MDYSALAHNIVLNRPKNTIKTGIITLCVRIVFKRGLGGRRNCITNITKSPESSTEVANTSCAEHMHTHRLSGLFMRPGSAIASGACKHTFYEFLLFRLCVPRCVVLRVCVGVFCLRTVRVQSGFGRQEVEHQQQRSNGISDVKGRRRHVHRNTLCVLDVWQCLRRCVCGCALVYNLSITVEMLCRP